MNYFGKRDYIYLDMRGQDEIDRMYTKQYTPPAEAEDEWKKQALVSVLLTRSLLNLFNTLIHTLTSFIIAY